MALMLCVSPNASKAIRHLLCGLRLMPPWLYGVCHLFLSLPNAYVAIWHILIVFVFVISFSPKAPVAI